MEEAFARLLEEFSGYSKEEYYNNFARMEEALSGLGERLGDTEKKGEYISYIEARLDGFPIWMQMHLQSFCMKVSGNSEITEKLLEKVRDASFDILGEYEKLSCYWQISTAVFTQLDLGSARVELLLTEIYRQLFEAFAEAFGIAHKKYIPLAERDRELVIVLSSQVLGMGHAPTKTLLDRCFVLKRLLKKEVVIINTAMQMTVKGELPFFDRKKPSYVAYLSEQKSLEFRGEEFLFYQCPQDMPNLDMIAQIISYVIKKRPCYIVNIGGSDLCADLCGIFVPEITISTVFSEISDSCGEYQLVNKQLTDGDRKRLLCLKVLEQKIWQTTFTFVFKEQTHVYQRSQLGLPEDAFIIFVIGWRLDEEIDDRFLAVLEEIAVRGGKVAVAVAGRYGCGPHRLSQRYPKLAESMVNMGKQEDMLAVLECGELYVNPWRHGGGSSAAEALCKGLPVVTLPSGDVSVVAGEPFWVSDYREMADTVLRYMTDTAFYREMSEKAKQRAALLTDSEASFGMTMQELEKQLAQE